ncbi:MAG: tRNA (N(6)-L-threonylcarbamoyladenosine(37)-C(2))-methylthiotransferase MtaB [Anaerolineae bacterium]|nr:tRNA (N(6)-L-threonylcarbamoyladenosine(37)-C(2))-methylthiotransferase MtaB [Anaerolineae bacterium]
MNQSEIEAMARRFQAAGHVVVGDPARADACVLNTCAVTAEAEGKTHRCIRELARAKPGARVAVAGCYATLVPQRCAALPGVAWVIPNADKDGVVETVGGGKAMRKGEADCVKDADISALSFDLPRPYRRTRAFVKVQDGCDNHCTYCVVRLLRGPSRSRPLAEVVEEIQALVEAGYQEVVLTGVNLGAYGRDFDSPASLRGLVETLLAQTDLPRLRLSSLEPWDLDEGFFQLWEDGRLCRQLHLPLQAGCDETLRRMGRRITTTAFARLVEAARAVVPDLAVTTDVIVGFPGEDEAAFRASYDFVEAIEFARLHVFPYSQRPGTPAACLPGRLGREARRERARAMRKLGTEQARRFRRQFLGREMMVLWERRRRSGLWAGLTDNYVRVVTRAEDDLHNQLVTTQLVAELDGCLVGEVIA